MSLETMVIFKMWSVLTLQLQIIYPFKHQCLWLKWTGPLSVMVWLLVLTIYLLNFIKQLKYGQLLVFDAICSIGMCETTDMAHFLLIITCFIDFIFITISIFPIIKTYTTLEQYRKTFFTLRTNQNYAFKKTSLILGFTFPIITKFPPFPPRMCLFGMLVSTVLLKRERDIFCQYLFLFVLPLNIMCSSLILLFVK